AHCAYISIALLSAERLRGPPCSTETEFAANPEAIAMSGSDMDLWTTVTPQLPTRNSEEPNSLKEFYTISSSQLSGIDTIQDRTLWQKVSDCHPSGASNIGFEPGTVFSTNCATCYG